MTVRTTQDRKDAIVLERVRTLSGEIGKPDERAVLVKDLAGLSNALAGAGKATAAVGGRVKTLAETLTEIGNLVNSTSTDLADVKTGLDAAQTDIAAIKAKLAAAAAINVPSITAQNLTAAPTKDDFNKAVSDLRALHQAVQGVANALG